MPSANGAGMGVPQQNRWRDRESGSQGRQHLEPSMVQKAVKRAGAKADGSSTMIYTHMLNRGLLGYTAQQTLCSNSSRWFSNP